MAGLHRLLALLALALGSVTVSVAEDGAKDGELRSLPCPDPQDISPCVCTVSEQHKMDIDCSQVESEDQLAQVFSSYIPFTNFHALYINENQHLKILRNGDLGPASFEWIYITGGVLEEVQDEALSQSYPTASHINFQANNVSKFPFHELSLFTSLVHLQMRTNSLDSFPVLHSDTLEEIVLNENLFGEIPLDGFHGVKNLYSISVSANDVEILRPGTLTDLPHLHYLHLDRNQLTDIPAGAIGFSEKGSLYLQNNNIKSIAIGSITGVNAGHIYLAKNSLVALEEGAFRPFLDGGATLDVDENPLGCGCDLAWLITNSNFMALTSPAASCYDGELLTSLDPAIYADLC
ncbi:oplophorus-luciferin 2-monooxygenase non-catalytic subunit-like [Penaeus chinensis]|uniref:oplophorus-luciferin 2-monooxygenase non-catalytic subunit-like n=1 Tax=Penaeus chinensis TaxID=139456 RepID=UPI001FB857F1|nr:oplophorus-luciferin 2-monooxygenase non-catalytic subunit-like [Penaeus chinensis]